MGASKVAHKRLMKEHAAIAKSPPPYIFARPNESNLLETNFILRGPEDSIYKGGEYWGSLQFTEQYPFYPPVIKLHTPSGRFQPDKSLCTSMSVYHVGSWNPAWSIETILTGLLSFMLDNEQTTGSIRSTDADKRIYAAKSHEFNIKQAKFKTIFPDYSLATMADLPNMGVAERNLPPAALLQQGTATQPPIDRPEPGQVQRPPADPQRGYRSFWLVAGVCVFASALLARLAS